MQPNNLQIPRWENEVISLLDSNGKVSPVSFSSFIETLSDRRRREMGPFNPQEHSGMVEAARKTAAANIRTSLQDNPALKREIIAATRSMLQPKLGAFHNFEVDLPRCAQWKPKETLADFAARTFNLSLLDSVQLLPEQRAELEDFWKRSKPLIQNRWKIDLDSVTREATDKACWERTAVLGNEEWLQHRIKDDVFSSWTQRIQSWEITLEKSAESVGQHLSPREIRNAIKFVLGVTLISGEIQDIHHLFAIVKEAVITKKPVSSMVLVCLRQHQIAVPPFIEILPDLEQHSFADGKKAGDERENIRNFLLISELARNLGLPFKTTLLISDIDFLTTEHSTREDPRFADAIAFQTAIIEFLTSSGLNKGDVDALRITEILDQLDWNTTFFTELANVIESFRKTLSTHDSDTPKLLIRGLHKETLTRMVDEYKVRMLDGRPDKIWLHLDRGNEMNAMRLQALLSIARDIVLSRIFSRIFDMFMIPTSNMFIPPGFNFGRLFTQKDAPSFDRNFREARSLVNIALPSKRLKISKGGHG